MNQRLTAVALTVAMAATSSLGAVSTADAKGCVKGAVVGGVAGHFAGRHALAGAAIGCVVGHHMAKSKARRMAHAHR